MSDLRSKMDAWEKETLAEELGARGERKERFATWSGDMTIRRLYTPLDLEGFDYMKDLGFPGTYPFTRGIDATMYRGALWTSEKYSGYGTSEDTNKLYKYLLSQGIKKIVMAMDLPSQMGYDPDHPFARGEVGKMGVAIYSLKDIEEIFDGIPLDSLSEAGTVANAIGPIALSWFIALAEKQGIPFTQFKIGLQNDSLKEFVGRGTYIFPLKESLRLSVDVVEWIAKNAPHWHPLEIGGTIYRWGGCTATQEIAFSVAVAIAYIEAALARGLSIDDVAPNLELHLTTDNDIFEEAAKFRALRRLWAKMMAERFGAKRIESLKLTGSINCAGYSCTAQQPLNNIVRLTLHSLGALLGGVECLNTPSFDEALGIPTPEAMAVALRTQQILAHETGIANTIDPLAGSYYVESLTNEFEARCNQYIKRIDEMGGALAAIEKGFMHREIEDAAYRFQREVERGDRVVVGVNKFESSESTQVKIFKVDPGVERRVQDKFARLKLQRDSRAVEETLRQLKVAAAGEGNLVRPITEAVKVYATTGEICDALREVFGEYRERPAYV